MGALCAEPGSGSFGGVCGSGPSGWVPVPNGEFPAPGMTGIPLVTVCPETWSAGAP